MKIIVGGSFRRFAEEIFAAADLLSKNGHEVLGVESVQLPYVVLNEQDGLKNDRLIQQLATRRMDAIQHADLFYTVNPGGYVGISTCCEMGCAMALGKKIYCSDVPSDGTIREYALVCEINRI